jgi:hypothetical protein
MVKKIRCDYPNCKKKLKLYEQIKCRCNKMYCLNHKSYSNHNCILKIDHKKIIKDNNPVIKNKKVEKI